MTKICIEKSEISQHFILHHPIKKKTHFWTLRFPPRCVDPVCYPHRHTPMISRLMIFLRLFALFLPAVPQPDWTMCRPTIGPTHHSAVHAHVPLVFGAKSPVSAIGKRRGRSKENFGQTVGKENKVIPMWFFKNFSFLLPGDIWHTHSPNAAFFCPSATAASLCSAHQRGPQNHQRLTMSTDGKGRWRVRRSWEANLGKGSQKRQPTMTTTKTMANDGGGRNDVTMETTKRLRCCRWLAFTVAEDDGGMWKDEYKEQTKHRMMEGRTL